MNLLNKLIREEEGQDLIEYVLLAAGIGVLCIPAVPALGTALSSKYVATTGQVGALP